MRWLFLFVFALNLAYIGWGLNQPPADPYANVKPLKNVAPIILLSELESDVQPSAPTEAQKTVAAVTAPPEKTEPETTSVSAADGVAGSGVEAQVSSSVEPLVDPESELLPGSLPESSPGVRSGLQSAVADAAADIKVIEAETSVSVDSGQQAEHVLASSSESGLPQPSQGCYTLGPFRDLEKLRRLTREIKSYVLSADFRGKEEKEQSLYWVYIKPGKNRQQAIKTGKRLKAKKIKDFYVIREGEKINGLSLGYFRSKSGATGLVKKVDKLGFDVVMEPVFKTYTVYWLDYQLKEGAEVPASVFKKYVPGTKKDRGSLVSRDCGN